MKHKDLRDKSIKDLQVHLNKIKSDLVALSLNLVKGKEKNVSKVRLFKKDIARCLSLIREKEIIEEIKNNA